MKTSSPQASQPSGPQVALVLSGGVALGAYAAGAYAALHQEPSLLPHHIAASSIGAVNGALIAGGTEDGRVERLRRFWQEGAIDTGWPASAWWGDIGREAESRAAIAQAHLLGRPRLFLPKLPQPHSLGLYSNQPLARLLGESVDFERLNDSQTRFSVITTDIESGDKVVFDTGRGQRIGVEHLLASSGFLPDFPAVEIEGRLLADGGLVANTPVEEAIGGPRERDLVCFIVEAFCAEGARPLTLEQGFGRRLDLLFANQTLQMLRALEREHALRCAAAETAGDAWPSVTLLHLAYRSPLHESPAGKMFNYSRGALEQRWEAGELDMRHALDLALGRPGAPASDRHVGHAVWHGCAAAAKRGRRAA